MAFNEIDLNYPICTNSATLKVQVDRDSDMQIRERFNLKVYYRRRMAFKRKQPDEQEEERTYQSRLSKACRDDRERTEK